MLRAVAALLALLCTPALAQNVLFPANQGDMIVKGATTWGPVPGGLAGYILQSNGPTAAPVWSNSLPLNFNLPPIPTNRVFGNVTGSQGIPSPITVNQFLDTIGYDTLRTPTNGSMIYKDPTTSTWQSLAASPTAGWALTSGNAGQAPVWAPVNGYITPGAAGTCLVSNGPSVAPSYIACPTGAVVVNSVFGRVGVVVATTNDYTVAQVTGAAPLASPSFTGFVGIGAAGNGINPLFIKQGATDAGDGLRIERNAVDTHLRIGYRTIGTPASAQNTWAFNASWSTTGAYADFTWITSDLERMRVATNGNIGIGTSAPATQLHTTGTVRHAANTCSGTGGTAVFDASGNLTCSVTAASSPGYYYVQVTPITTCTTDGSVDCTAVIQAQITACDAGKGGWVVLPAGILLVNGGLTSSRCSIKGAPWKVFQGSGTTFTIPDTGTFIKQTTTANSILTLSGAGVVVEDVGFTQTQPVNAGFPGPTLYPPVVVSSAGGATFNRINLFGVTKGMTLGGGDTVENISGSCFTYCLKSINVGEVQWVRKTYFHAYIIGDQTNIPNLLAYIQANGVAIDFERADSPQFSDIFVFGFNAGFKFRGNAGTPTTRYKISNFDCDWCTFGIWHVTTANGWGLVTNMSVTSNTGGGGAAVECDVSCVLDITNLESRSMGASTIIATGGSDVSVTNSRTNSCNTTNAGWSAMYATAGSTITLSGRYTFTAGFCVTSTGGGGTFNVGNVN